MNINIEYMRWKCWALGARIVDGWLHIDLVLVSIDVYSNKFLEMWRK